MSSSIDRARGELELLGYETHQFDSPQGSVVSFPYTIETGSHEGRQVRVGIGFQEEGYPEYPPHWIHVSPPIEDGKGGAHSYRSEGREWIVMSRPPGDFWDNLPTKHMDAYVREHLRRIWKDV